MIYDHLSPAYDIKSLLFNFFFILSIIQLVLTLNQTFIHSSDVRQIFACRISVGCRPILACRKFVGKAKMPTNLSNKSTSIPLDL